MIVQVEALNATVQHLGAVAPIQREQRAIYLSYVPGHIPSVRRNPDIAQEIRPALQPQTAARAIRLRSGACAVEGAAQSSSSFGGKLPRPFCRCSLRLDLRGGFLWRQGAQFLGFAMSLCGLRVRIAGFALGADKSRSYRLAAHSFGSQLLRE